MNHKKYLRLCSASHIGIKQQDVKNKFRAENKRLRTQIAECRRLYAELAEQAIRDPLTGIYNRQYMESMINLESIQEQQETAPVSIVMLDMDNLKKINDTFGHTVGDMALRTLGNKFRQMTRAEDVVCRYGGDEFIIFLHGVNTETAYKRAEEWRRSIEESPIGCQNTQIRITISAGVATHTIHGTTITQTIEAADKALYWAKNMGRNHVAVADNINQTLYSLPYNFLAVA
jgi:diguanylate cyclase (GGDEF)-like protein